MLYWYVQLGYTAAQEVHKQVKQTRIRPSREMIANYSESRQQLAPFTTEKRFHHKRLVESSVLFLHLCRCAHIYP